MDPMGIIGDVAVKFSRSHQPFLGFSLRDSVTRLKGCSAPPFFSHGSRTSGSLSVAFTPNLPKKQWKVIEIRYYNCMWLVTIIFSRFWDDLEMVGLPKFQPLCGLRAGNLALPDEPDSPNRDSSKASSTVPCSVLFLGSRRTCFTVNSTSFRTIWDPWQGWNGLSYPSCRKRRN